MSFRFRKPGVHRVIEIFSEWLNVVLLTLIAGLSIVAGALIARFENICSSWLREEFRHSVIAFGGGALLSAVALVLVPEGIKNLELTSIVIWFMAGAAVFAFVGVQVRKSKSSISNLIAMLSDFVPEAMAVGSSIALGGDSALLITGLIGLQNVPEGFNAYREMIESKIESKKILIFLSLMALLGPISGLIGFHFLSSFPKALSAIMLFSSGGIFYIVFQDIAPQSKLECSWKPALAACSGFLLGMVGHVFSH